MEKREMTTSVAIGLGLAQEEFAAKLFSGDGSPDGVLNVAGKLDEDSHKRMKEGWRAAHEGRQ